MNYEERHRCPEGYYMVEAFMNGKGRLVIMGEPSEDDPGHNCDEMGCGSFDHVAEIVQIDNPRQIDEVMRLAKLLDKYALQQEIAKLEKQVPTGENVQWDRIRSPVQRDKYLYLVELRKIWQKENNK
jgi:hypothetical protein